MNWMSAMMSGLSDAAFSVRDSLVRQQELQQKQQLMQQQAQIERQKMLFMESIKAPTEKSYLDNDPDPARAKQGWKSKVTQAWVPPTADGQAGYYKTIGSESIPPHWEIKDGVSLGSGVKGSVAINPETYDPKNPGSYTVIGRDDTEAQRTMVENAHLGIDAGRLAEERRYHDAEIAREGGGNGKVGTYDIGDYQVAGRIGPDNVLAPARTASGQIVGGRRNKQNLEESFGGGSYVNGKFVPGAAPTDTTQSELGSMFAPGPSTNPPPLGQLNTAAIEPNAPTGKPNVTPGPMRTGGSGAAPPGATVPASGASANPHGKVLRYGTDKKTGARVAQYEDGTVAPA